MLYVFKQWIARAVALAVVGPMCAMFANRVVGVDGSHSTTFLTGSSIGSGAGALLMVLALTGVMGAVIGRAIDRREGLLNMAFVFAWVAWSSGRLGEVYRVSPESGTLIKLMIESLVVLLGVAVALVLMTDPKKGLASGHEDDVSRFDCSFFARSILSVAGVASLGAALGGALVISLLFGQSDLPGQAVGVGFGAGIVGGVLGTLTNGSLGKDEEKRDPFPIIAQLISRRSSVRGLVAGLDTKSSGTGKSGILQTPFAPLMVGVMLVGVVGPMVGMVVPGAGDLVGLVIHGDLPGYLIVSPMAWAMGALMGVPVGHSWVEHSAQQVAPHQAVA